MRWPGIPRPASRRPSGPLAACSPAPGRRRTSSCSTSKARGDYVKLRGGNGTDSDAYNVVYRDNCNFIWNNDRDTIYLYKPSGSRADVHSYTKSANDPDGNGYITFH